MPNNFIGVHFRNTDMQHPFENVIDRINQEIRENHVDTLFWATDDVESIGRASKALPSLQIISLSTIPTLAPNQKCLHYLNDKALLATGIDKKVQITDTLLDIYVLSLANKFIDSPKSSLSRFVRWLRTDSARIERFFRQE